MEKIFILIHPYQEKVLDWEPKISNFESLNNSYKNFLQNDNLNYGNLAAHKRPLKSYLLKYASIFFKK